jgi:DNA-binding beta-propeller fold protein YncE
MAMTKHNYFNLRKRSPQLAWCLSFGLVWSLCHFALVILTSCSPTQSTDLHSAFFSSVEIIGTRGTSAGKFNKPRSLALDAQDNLYVADMTGRVQKFSPEGRFLFAWQFPETPLGKPKGMTLDAQGHIIVLEPHYSRVNHFDSNGKLLEQWGHHGTNDGQLAFPRSVGVNSQGDIYTSEYGVTERVQKFSGKTKQWLQTISAEFNRPEGLGIDKADKIYVADSCNHQIKVFSPSGQLLRAYGGAGNALGKLSYPYDVRVDAAGFQYVCEFGNSRLQIFDATDKPVEIIGGPGSAPGQFNNPWSIAFDSHGNLFVADSQNHRVQKFIRKQH